MCSGTLDYRFFESIKLFSAFRIRTIEEVVITPSASEPASLSVSMALLKKVSQEFWRA